MQKMEGGGKSEVYLSGFYLNICYGRRDGMIAQYNLILLITIQKQTLKAKINSQQNEKFSASESVIKNDIAKFIISKTVMRNRKMLLKPSKKYFGKLWNVLFFLFSWFNPVLIIPATARLVWSKRSTEYSSILCIIPFPELYILQNSQNFIYVLHISASYFASLLFSIQ